MDSFPIQRTPKDVSDLLTLAKIDEADLRCNAQSLFFSENLHHKNICLFELDRSILEDLKSCKNLIIRGRDNDTAVLCTDAKTFELKESETSNTLLLFEGDLSCCDTSGNLDVKTKKVETLKHNYYELKPTRPRLKRLKEKLEEHPFIGCDTDQQDLYRFEDLLNEVQSSEKELLDGLKNLHACLIDGHWRLLDFQYLCSLFRSLLAIVDENGWSYGDIPAKELVNSLEELYDKQLTKYLMDQFTLREEEQDVLCSLNEQYICRLYAEMILRTTAKFNLVEFLETWKLSVPDGMTTHSNQFKNMAVVDRDNKPEVIRYFPASDLPEDIDTRFQILFKFKEKWTLDDIAPYLEDLCGVNVNVGNLLMKYARLSTYKGVKVYSSKKT